MWSRRNSNILGILSNDWIIEWNWRDFTKIRYIRIVFLMMGNGFSLKLILFSRSNMIIFRMSIEIGGPYTELVHRCQRKKIVCWKFLSVQKILKRRSFLNFFVVFDSRVFGNSLGDNFLRGWIVCQPICFSFLGIAEIISISHIFLAGVLSSLIWQIWISLWCCLDSLKRYWGLKWRLRGWGIWTKSCAHFRWGISMLVSMCDLRFFIENRRRTG